MTLSELLKYGRSLDRVKLKVSTIPSTSAENGVYKIKQPNM